MFIKVVENSAWDFGEALSANVKLSSRGLIGNDRRDLIKRASAELIDKIDSMEFSPGEVPVHLIAMGATESYGPNRNGDGFSSKACEEYHPYFVKDAHVYRNHKNTDPKQSYGIVKASAFNKEMDRVELIVALNGNEKAAKKNGGLVADKELDKLENDKDFSVSMACTPDKNTLILTREKSYLPIERVNVGMHVWTKEYRWREVTEIKRRQYTGKIYEFHLQDLPFVLKFTSEHPLFVQTPEKECIWLRAEAITPDMTLLYAPLDRESYGYKALKYIKQIEESENPITITINDKSLFLSLRDYCLLHSYKFSVDKSSFDHNFPDDTSNTYVLLIQKESEKQDKVFPCAIQKIVSYMIEDTTVYNLEVDEDHCYTAYGIISHNCKVPFDKCSYCGNKAATRDEYCRDIDDGGHCKAGGLYHNMGKTASVDGKIHQLYADNTEPYFFDISHVFIPADRIAYTTGMLKKSSAGIVSGSDLADLYGISLTGLHKRAAYTPIDANYKQSIAYLCDAVTNFHNGAAWKQLDNYLGVVDPEPLNRVKTASMYSYAEITNALNRANKCLTPTQFLQVVGNMPYAKAVKAAEVIGPLSNECFRDLALNDSEYNPFIGKCRPIPSLYDWASSQKCASWDTAHLVKQAAVNTVASAQHHHYSLNSIYAMQEDPAVQTLSKTFALYKVAFLSSVPAKDKKHIAKLLVGRDYLSH